MSDDAAISAGMKLTAEQTVSSAKAASRRGPGSVRTILLIASLTFREAARRKILLIAALAGVAFVLLFLAALHFVMTSMAPDTPALNRKEGVGMMQMMVLYAGSMMTSLMAALTSCDTLAGEISSGTIHAMVTKPIRRWWLVLGKWVGFAGMLTLYVLLVEGGCLAVGWLAGHYVAPHPVTVLALIWLQAMVVLGVTLASSTRFSALTSGAMTLGLYGLAFVGGWIEQFGALRHVKACANLGIVTSLLMPSDALWRRAAFKVQPPLLATVGVSPFSSTQVPNAAMVAYAAVYALAALMLAMILFERRDL